MRNRTQIGIIAIFIIIVAVIMIGMFGFRSKVASAEDAAELQSVNMVKFLEEKGIEVNTVNYEEMDHTLECKISNDIDAKILTCEYEKGHFEKYIFIDFHGNTLYPVSPRDGMAGGIISTDKDGLIKVKGYGINTVYIDDERRLIMTDADLDALDYLLNGGEIYGCVYDEYDFPFFSPVVFISENQSISSGEVVFSPALAAGVCSDSRKLISWTEYQEKYGQ